MSALPRAEMPVTADEKEPAATPLGATGTITDSVRAALSLEPMRTSTYVRTYFSWCLQVSALVNESPSRAMVNALSKQQMVLPELPAAPVFEEVEEEAAEDGDGKFLYKNARGEWVNLLEMSVGTLSGMLLDWSKEKREKECEVEQSSFQQILHDAAAVDGHSTM